MLDRRPDDVLRNVINLELYCVLRSALGLGRGIGAAVDGDAGRAVRVRGGQPDRTCHGGHDVCAGSVMPWAGLTHHPLLLNR